LDWGNPLLGKPLLGSCLLSKPWFYLGASHFGTINR